MSDEKRDPLQGIEEPERTWLIEIAKREGMAIDDVLAKREKVAEKIRDALEPHYESMQEQAMVERTVVGTLKAIGVNAAGFWSAMKSARTGSIQNQGASDGGNARAQFYARDYQNDLERTMEKNPRWGVTTARTEVAAQHGVSLKTVERHTTDPRKK